MPSSMPCAPSPPRSNPIPSSSKRRRTAPARRASMKSAPRASPSCDGNPRCRRAARSLDRLALVLLLRLPFLNQAIQGDDHTYLTEAFHALIDPLHPMHTTDVFLGNPVDLRGHSHPPLDAWILAALIATFGEIREVPFHAVYMVFSIIATAAMWSLARRFSPHPLWAALLFLAVPAFVVNGNSFETDVPFLAFWLAAVALFLSGRFVLASLAMALAALTS